MTPEAALDLVRPAPDDGRPERLRIGFIPLVDCAPLVVARAGGFAAREGLELDLVRETSWANIRDRLVLGHFDAAHMLAPMAVAARLGLGHLVSPVVAPFVIDHGGNSIVATPRLAEAIAARGGGDDPAAIGAALAEVVRARLARGEEPPTFATVHPFSCHNYQLRYWLAAAGLDPDRDVRLVVVPPPYMVDAMTSGMVEAACVGAPWPELAAAAGVGCILMSTAATWTPGPEKVLGVREAFIERRPHSFAALMRCLDRAAAWVEDPANRDDLVRLLADEAVIGVEAAVIAAALAEGPRFHGAGPVGPINRPRPADGLWLATQMVRWGHARAPERAFEAAQIAFSPTAWDATIGAEAAVATSMTVMPFDGAAFDGADPEAWLATHPATRTGPIFGES
mgnify:CR=1 FL=1